MSYQILTDDAFTLIDVLPAPESGWRLRVWKRDAAALTQSGGFYLTAGFIAEPPTQRCRFQAPHRFQRRQYPHLNFYIQKETTGLAGTRTITNEIVQTLGVDGKPATVTSSLYVSQITLMQVVDQE